MNRIKRLLPSLLILLVSLTALFACDGNGEEQPPCEEHIPGAVELENEVKVSCTANGSYDEVTYCTLCDAELSRVKKTVNPTGHDMGSYKSNNDATCTKDGTKTKTCQNGCGYKETVADAGTAKGHVGTKLVSSDGESCNGKPLGKIYCAECNELMGEYGHKYEKSITQPTCDQNGATTYTCTECRYSYSEDIPKIGHVFSAWETTKQPTCNAEGTATRSCIVCGGKKEEKAIDKIPHSYNSTLVGNELILECRECGESKDQTVNNDVFTVSFEENGGSAVSDMALEKYAIPDLPVSEYEGFVFLGWYVNEELTEIYSGAAISEDTVFYAKWQKLETLSDEEDIIKGAPLDYKFQVVSETALDSANINNYVQVKTVSGEMMEIYATQLDNGVYEIGCDNYEAGTNYFVTLTNGAAFEGRKTNALWIITEGDREDVLELKSDVIKYSLDKIYGISETREGMMIVTYEDILDVGNKVAFYENNMNAYRFGVKVLTKNVIGDCFGYTVELLDVDDLFERCEVNHSSAIDFTNAELNVELKNEISEAFLASEIYGQYVRATSAISSKYGSKMGDPNFEVGFFPKGENFTIRLSVSAETDVGIVFTMVYYIELAFDVDFSLDGKNSTLLLSTDMVNRVQLDVDGIHAYGSNARTRLLAEYRDMFNMIKEKNALINPDGESEDVKTNVFDIATVPLKTGLVTLHLDITAQLDFAMMGGVSAELVHKLHSEVGLRGGDFYSDYEAKLVSINGCAYTGIDIYGGIGVSLGASFCGLTGYIKGTIGMHGELTGAAVLSITEKSSYVLGDYKFDSEVLMDMQVGVKYEVRIFGFKKTYLDNSFTAAESGAPFIEIGDNELALHFTDNSHSTEDTAIRLGEIKCSDNGINVSTRINTQILFLNIETFVTEIKDVSCEYRIVNGNSGSAITKDGKLVISGMGEFTICVAVKYGDVIEKRVYFKGEAVHEYTEMTEEYLRYEASCTRRASYFYSCSGCGAKSPDKYFERGELLDHVVNEYYSYDEDSHWYACRNLECSYKKNVRSHALVKSYEERVSYADCYNPDVYMYYCTTCKNYPGPTFEEGEPLPHKLEDDFTCHDRTCTRCWAYEEKYSTNHRDDCGVCMDCETKLYDFKYELKSDGTYEVVGTYKDYGHKNVDFSAVGIPGYYKGKAVTSIAEHAFENANNIIGLKISEGIKTIGNAAFSGCSNLKSIALPGTLGAIGNGMFANCTGLESVTIGDGITEIGNGAFFGCTGLTTVYMADSVVSVIEYAFQNCSALSDVYYTGSESDWSNIVIGSDNARLKKANIHYDYVIEE